MASQPSSAAAATMPRGVEVGCRPRRRRERVRGRPPAHVQRRRIVRGEDGDGRDAELARRARDPDRDLAAVGDQQTLREHDGCGTISPGSFRVDPPAIPGMARFAAPAPPAAARRPLDPPNATRSPSSRPETESRVALLGRVRGHESGDHVVDEAVDDGLDGRRVTGDGASALGVGLLEGLQELLVALFRQFGSIACPLPNDVA